MKLCPTCGRSVPDQYSTSHHPNGCPCHLVSLHAPDGNNQGPDGCIWSQHLEIPKDAPRGWAYEQYMKLMRDRAVSSKPGQVQ